MIKELYRLKRIDENKKAALKTLKKIIDEQIFILLFFDFSSWKNSKKKIDEQGFSEGVIVSDFVGFLI